MNSKLLLILLLGSSLFLAGCFAPTQRPAKPELCNQVSIPANKDVCFHRVAVTIGDSQYCSQISDLNTRDLCFSDLARGQTWVSGAGTD